MAQTLSCEDEVLREQMDVVARLARRILCSLSLRIEFEDLYQVGCIALVRCRSRATCALDSPRFRGYFIRSARGAMIDAISTLTGVTRAQLRRARRMLEASEHAAELEDGDAAHGELWRCSGHVLDIPLPRNITSHVTTLTPAEDDDSSPVTLVTPDEEDPAEQSLRREAFEQVYDAMNSLDREEKRLLSLCYGREMPMSEYARRAGVSRSWASRIHRRALRKIKVCVHDAEVEPRVVTRRQRVRRSQPRRRGSPGLHDEVAPL